MPAAQDPARRYRSVDAHYLARSVKPQDIEREPHAERVHGAATRQEQRAPGADVAQPSQAERPRSWAHRREHDSIPIHPTTRKPSQASRQRRRLGHRVILHLLDPRQGL